MSGTTAAQPLVSVVTPVYNGADTIVECIESVLGQTYENWEYVIVDNCSDDGTLEIARSYEAREPRLRVVAPGIFVDKTTSANRAMLEISPDSTYCKVLHADDWIFPECLERMVDLAERFPTVGVVSAYRLEETRVTLEGLPRTIDVLSGREIVRSTLLGTPYPYLFGSPSSLLIRSDLIRAREPFYDPDYPFAEKYALTDDQDACCAILRECDFGFVHQVLTFTRRLEHSPFSAFVRLGAHLPEQIKLLARYGDVYLTRAEYQRHLAVLLVHYFLFLVGNVRRLAEPEFRTYHRLAFQRLRRDIEPRDALRGVRLQLARMARAGRLRPGRV